VTIDLEAVFKELRQILIEHKGGLTVSKDTDSIFCLEGGVHPRTKKAFPVAWTEINKNYVSFHLMSVYAIPRVRSAVPEALEKRMQGKSCFNFNSVDASLLRQLSELTATSLTDLPRNPMEWK